MAVTGTYTARQLIQQAMRKIGLVAKDTDATASEINDALIALNLMLKGWQNRGYNLFNYASQPVTLTTAASYTLSPVRPVRILSVNFKKSGLETPMTRLTREEYDALPNKASTGTPTTWYYDRQRESALLYVWPVLSAASGETLQVTYEAEYEDQTDLDAVVPVPGEWWEAVVYNLASRLADDYQMASPDVDRVIMRAQVLLREAEANDREGSLFFGDGEEAYSWG